MISSPTHVEFLSDDGSCPLTRKLLSEYGFDLPDLGQEISFKSGTLLVTTILNVADRDTKAVAHIRLENSLKYCEKINSDKVMRFLRLELIRAFAHEIDEQIMLSGQRIFDPHLRKHPMMTMWSE